MIKLYDFQEEKVNAVRDFVSKGYKSVLLASPTGSGKTAMATAIVYGAYKKEKVCFFVVPRRDLLDQTSLTLAEFGIPHSFIAAGKPCNTFARVFVCSTGTLQNRLSIVPDIAIIDESHYGDKALDKIIKYYKSNGAVVIGLSATPWKLSGKGLGCWYDKMVEGKSVRWLIDNKRLSEYRAFAPSHPDLSGIKIQHGDYVQSQLAEKMEQDRILIGNAVKHYKQHAAGKLGITFGVSIKHSQILAQSYRDAGIPAMHIDGETPEDERKKISRAFAKREIMQLCNAELLCFGYDLATSSGIKGVCIQSMTDCQPTMSLAKQSQKNGRNLRYDGETHLFFDHANNFQKHGLPDHPHEWTLSDRDKQSKESGEKTIPVRMCDVCSYCHTPAPVCPNCGNTYKVMSREIKEVEGELSEIQAVQQKKEARMEVGKARSLEDLIAIGKKRGYKNPVFWAKKIMAGRNA